MVRNLQSTEKEVLFKQKVEEGKSEDLADYEIERDMTQIRNLNQEIREKKSEVLKLRKEREKVNNQWREEFEKLTKAQDKANKPIRFKTNNSCSTIYLHRIIQYLKDSKKPLGLGEITEECMIKKDHVKNGLIFLIKYKIVKEVYNKGQTIYELEKT